MSSAQKAATSAPRRHNDYVHPTQKEQHRSREFPTVISPVFLVGARRSGTTLMRLMLDSHPDICWQRGWEAATDKIGDDGQGPSTVQLRELGRELDIPGAFHIDGRIDGLSNLRRLLSHKIRSDLAINGEAVFGATCHTNFHRLAYLWDDAKYIHLIRDPRDVAYSVVKMGWEANYWHASRRWIRAEEEWQVLRSRIPRERWIDLTYEALVTNAEQELRRVCDFLEVPFTRQMFDYTKTSNYGMPDPSLAERWRNRLVPKQTRLVDSRSWETMQRYRYEPSGTQFRPSAVYLACASIHNRLGKLARRIHRHGLSTVLLGVLVNRMRISSLKPALDRRLAVIHRIAIERAEANYHNVRRG